MPLRLLLAVFTVWLFAPQVDDESACRKYDPTTLTIHGPTGKSGKASLWTVEAAGALFETAASEADAEHIVQVAHSYTEECRIVPILDCCKAVTYWKGQERPLTVTVPEDCRKYDPAKLEYRNLVVEDTTPRPTGATEATAPWMYFRVPGEKQGQAVIAIAQGYTTACVIGGWQWIPPPGWISPLDGMPEETLRLDRMSDEGLWNPVYYWKD